ncbi:hypothetical protein ACFLWI_03520 [Chloroflexota bacterium]
MNKIKASILVIGFQKEDHNMYPHLYDCLQNLRNTYDDVIYVGDGDQHEGLYSIDSNLRGILHIFSFKTWLQAFRALFIKFSPYAGRRRRPVEKNEDANIKHDGNLAETIDFRIFLLAGKFLVNRLCSVVTSFVSYVRRQRRLRKNLKNVRFKYDKRLVLAIDHTSCFAAEKYFPGKVVLWSFDILTKDYPMRIKNGFLERPTTSKDALRARALIIQDEQRKKLLEESIGVTFPNTIYLPVSLNDSEFCRKASESRQKKTSFATVNIVQSGWIVKNRWSDKLIDEYQNWPTWYKLNLRGFIGSDIRSKLLNIKRMPYLSESIYDNTRLPEILNNHDIGFVGYAEKDSNHKYIENASAQLVNFLRLGLPVIGCGSPLFNDFVTKQNIGIGVSPTEETEGAIRKIIDNYSFFSHNARRLYESRYNLNSHFDKYLIKSFESLL